MNVLKFLFLIVLIGGLSGCSTTPSGESNSKTVDEGYFLSWEQKGQLIGSGRIKDASGNWYDVWVVPGYNQSTESTIKYLKKTGDDFGEYFGSKKYSDLGDTSWDMFCFGYDDCFYDFTIKGLPKAWGEYWSKADERTSKRVFGWWVAYPWALMESTVDPVVRIPLGLSGTVLGTVLGTVAVPSYYAVDSTVKGAWDLTMNTILLPTVACTWNTMIAPPMALVGQKPAPARTDGFWVKQLSAEDLKDSSMTDEPIIPKDIEALAVWGRLLLKTVPPFDKQRQVVARKAIEERNAINKKEREETQAIDQKMAEAIEALFADPTQKETLDYLRNRNFNPSRTSKAFEDLRQYFKDELSANELQQLIQLMHRYAPSATTHQPFLRPKTDPVKHSVDVIKEME